MSRSSLKNVMRLIADVQKDVPVEESFLSDLERSIELSDMKDTRKPSQTYKPSSMNCIRNMYYQVTGVDPDPSSSSYALVGIVHSGSDIHERTQKAVASMKDNGMDCEYIDVAEYVQSRDIKDVTIVSHVGMETKLYHEKFKLSFMCDGIIRYKGKYYILELKTESSYKWQNRKGVDPKHYAQATAYALALGINEVIFVYISRDVLTMKSFMFTVTDSMKIELINKIDQCESHVALHSVPPKSEQASGKFCQYCMYRTRCECDG